MIPRELKEKAIKLRRNGVSYNLITKETGITKATLSYWFGNSNWSEDILLQNKVRNVEESRQRILLMNKQRTLNLEEKYNRAKLEAKEEFEKFKNDPLFVGALMLYLGEGDKNGRTTRISNVKSEVHKIFIKFILKFCGLKYEDIRFWILSYPDLDQNECKMWWKKELSLSDNNFYKTQVIQGKHKTKKLIYGVGTTIIGNKFLKIKILKWIELLSRELIDAAIV